MSASKRDEKLNLGCKYKEKAKQYTPTEISECNKLYQNVSQLIKLDCKRLEPDSCTQKLTHFTVSKKDNKIPVGATWGHRPHNFLAVGAIAPIAPMESAPMVVNVVGEL